MAGGKGSRISELFPDIPKPLIPIEGVPVLERELLLLREQGFTDIIITLSHMSEQIIDYFGNGTNLGIKIEYYVEKIPLGNAGALFKLEDKLGDEPFLLLNADTVFDVDFKRMVEYHRANNALVTLFTHPNSHPYDSGLIISDDEKHVEAWLTKEEKKAHWYSNRVNAGLHVIDPQILYSSGIVPGLVGTINPYTNKEIKVDLDRQLLRPLVGSKRMFCYDSPEYVKDMGTPERYQQVCEDHKSGIITSRNLKRKQKAIFLDRDGTINNYVGFLRNVNDFELIPGVAKAIKHINCSGYLCIVVTNQPVIARGEISWEKLSEIHKKMETKLGIEGAYLDKIYYCPHHPHRGYVGEISELKINCSCRKPKPGMLLEAAKEFNIDLSKSFMIGDSESDIQAGIAAGCQSILINGYGTAHTNGYYGQIDTLDSVLAFTEKYLS